MRGRRADAFIVWTSTRARAVGAEMQPATGLHEDPWLVHGMHVNRQLFSAESKKKLRRPCREARALER